MKGCNASAVISGGAKIPHPLGLALLSRL